MGARKLGGDEVIGFAEERGEFRLRHNLRGHEGDPFGTGQIGRREDAGAFREFGELFGISFEREPDGRGNQGRDGKHFAGDFEDQVVFPLDLFRSAGEGKADFAQLVDVHIGAPSAGWRRAIMRGVRVGGGSGMGDTQANPYETRLNIYYQPLEIVEEKKLADECAFRWYNQTLCRVNGSVVRLGVFQGEYHWHKHDQDDEFFYVLEGELLIDFEERSVSLKPRQGFVVPSGMLHRTRAAERTVVLMVENAGIIPTGN